MVQQVRWACARMYLLTLPLLSFARVGHACHFETFNISKKSLSKTPQQHRHWSGPCSLSLSLAFCPVVIVLSQPAVWCHYNTRSHLKYWFARRRWEEGTKSYEISWKADRAWFFFFYFIFSLPVYAATISMTFSLNKDSTFHLPWTQQTSLLSKFVWIDEEKRREDVEQDTFQRWRLRRKEKRARGETHSCPLW